MVEDGRRFYPRFRPPGGVAGTARLEAIYNIQHIAHNVATWSSIQLDARAWTYPRSHVTHNKSAEINALTTFEITDA